MSYLKVVENNIVEAPYMIERDGQIIYGYNKQNNEVMLFKDGYAYYPYPASNYIVVNGQIIPKPIPEPVKNTIFTKLKIRRAMRKLECEIVLDSILRSVPEFQKEWNDAIEIDVADPMIQQAVDHGLIPQGLYNKIVKELQDNDNSEQI